MTCELWVRGLAEYNGKTYIDIVWKTPWDQNTAPPAISFKESSVNGWDYYFDGFGGVFGFAGWYEQPEYYLKNCGNKVYDCLNGTCIPTSKYNTPGLYASLAECQGACEAPKSPSDGYCPPGKICVPADEWSEIESLSVLVKQKLCGG